MNRIFSAIALTLSLSFVACGGTDLGESETPERRQQTLKAADDCAFASCGSIPSSLSNEPVVECGSSPGAECAWSDTSNDASSSYRYCADSECPTKPEVDCPAGTVFGSQQCGSENAGPCAWTTSCVPPRVTTPCPDSHGCDGIPVQTIGIICKDGSTGGFACVTDGKSCFLERNCD
jgi:hypothetical protein